MLSIFYIITGCFQDRCFHLSWVFSWTICLGWFRTTILLISASWIAKIIGHQHRSFSLNFTSNLRAGGVAQVVKYLLSKCQTLCSNPNTTSSPQKSHVFDWQSGPRVKSDCLSSVKPWVQIPVPSKKKKPFVC
jgi:hypothetical protein